MSSLVIGVDLGGTQIRVGLVREDGRVLRREALPTQPQEGRDAVVWRIVQLVRSVSAKVGIDEVAGVGVAAPGPVNLHSGVVRLAPNLEGWVDVPLQRLLQEQLHTRVYLGNDANLAALGEHTFGAGRHVNDMIYITVSTGIGGGIIVGGRLLVGHNGYGAEIGHHTVADSGPRCKCGNIGCLEAVASGTAIAREGRVAIVSEEETLLRELCEGNVWKLDARQVAEAATRGDAVARQIMHRAGHYLGVGIVNMMHIFNPQRIILGGSVMKAGRFITDPMWEVVNTRSWAISREDFDIVEAALGDNVGILGAAALVLRSR